MFKRLEHTLTGHRESHLQPPLYRTLNEVHFTDSGRQCAGSGNWLNSAGLHWFYTLQSWFEATEGIYSIFCPRRGGGPPALWWAHPRRHHHLQHPRHGGRGGGGRPPSCPHRFWPQVSQTIETVLWIRIRIRILIILVTWIRIRIRIRMDPHHFGTTLQPLPLGERM
jgi:hypothetical protein